MELLQLKYFKAVAESEKISTTAANLFISPPALSASITRLERELNVKLFDRNGNRITLNQEGQIFLHYVNQVFTNLEYAKIDIEHSLHGKNESIRIAVTSSDLWMKMLADCCRKYPDIHLSSATIKLPLLTTLDMTRKYSFLLADKSDMASQDLKHITDTLTSVPLFQDFPYVMVPASHRLAKRKSIHLHELSSENLYLPMAEQSLNIRLHKMFQDSNFPLKHANECSVNICQYMVSDGQGISFTTAHTPHTANNIRYIPLKGVNTNWEQHLYWQKNRYFPEEVQMIKDFIIDYYLGIGV